MPDDGRRYETFDGRLKTITPGASATHQMVCSTFLFTLTRRCKSDHVVFHPPFDAILDRTTFSSRTS